MRRGRPPEKRAVQECVAEQNWTRAGFECAMEATPHAALQRCLTVNYRECGRSWEAVEPASIGPPAVDPLYRD